MPDDDLKIPEPMTEREQIDAFVNDLADLIRRYSEEYEISNAAVIGVLEIEKQRIINDMFKRYDGDDDDN